MPNYSFEALGRDGEFVSGEITAARVSEVISQLEAQGLQVESIRAIVPVPDLSLTKKAFYDRIDLALESRESLIPALDALADEMPHRDAARDVRQFVHELKSGVTAEQFVNRESTVPWLPLIVRGFGSSTTAERYGQLMDDATRESENRKNLRTVLAYPLFLLAFGGIVLIFLVLLVVPTFDKMFSEFNLRVPPQTMLLLWISRQLTLHSLRTVLVVVAAFLLIVVVVRLWLRFALSTRLFGLFTSGNSANVTAMAKFTGSLAELISIEAPLPEALRIAGRACKHYHFRVMAERLASDLEIPGARLRDSSVAHNFPATMCYALGSVRSGKATVPLLRELSRMYSDRARARSSWSTSILGPISLVGLGLLVGFVLIALFSPLVYMITSLG